MKEITGLSATRKQLAEKYFYYNGCECSNAEDKQIDEELLNLAADVLIQILTEEHTEE